MWDWLDTTFGAGFMPHGHCYMWSPSMVWLQFFSNLLIGLAYVSISVTLYYIVRKIRNVPFSWMYVAFGVFILACGLTHFIEIITIWHPIYWADGTMRALTAAASVLTAVLLVYMVPRSIALGESAQLAEERGVQLREAFKALEIAHDKAHQRLAAIVESSADAVFSQSLDERITTWNRGAEQLLGYAPEDAIGQPASMLIPPARAATESQLLEDIRHSRRVAHFETTRLRRDGTELDVSVTLSPIRDTEAAEVVGVSTIARDITEQKRRDSELERSNAELEQFAYVASHDLQEPLRMVANYTELLATRYSGHIDAKADKYIHYAIDGARRMQQLVADLLEYSRVGSEGRVLAPVSVNEVVTSVVESLTRETGAVIEVESLPTVLADDGQLRRVFQNLIGNALKFRGETAPHVSITAQRDHQRWIFSVRDNGIGLDMAYAEKIFQMFQRLHERGRYPGSGIGLAVAKRIVERHGGKIWLESSPGAGTTFLFTLPAVADSSSTPRTRASSKP